MLICIRFLYEITITSKNQVTSQNMPIRNGSNRKWLSSKKDHFEFDRFENSSIRSRSFRKGATSKLTTLKKAYI